MNKGIVHILANDGSPIGVTEKSIYGDDGKLGIGGAELFILTMCRGWHDAGYEVVFYNDPKESNGSVFEHRPIAAFDPQASRDILITFRSPNPKSIGAKGKRIWLSCDQFTIGNFLEFSRTQEKIVVISPFHANYFKTTYGISNTIVIDIPVRTWEYRSDLQKVSKRCIFTSIPDRGLMELAPAWARIVAAVPEATLVITSDYRLWVEWADSGTHNYRVAFSRLPNVIYHGAINRRQLIQEQMQAELHLYTGIYEELFCIAVAESQVAGAYPLTTDCGALATTNMGTLISGHPSNPQWQDIFVEKTIHLLQNDDERIQLQQHVREKALERFSMDRILEEWETKVFKDG